MVFRTQNHVHLRWCGFRNVPPDPSERIYGSAVIFQEECAQRISIIGFAWQFSHIQWELGKRLHPGLPSATVVTCVCP